MNLEAELKKWIHYDTFRPGQKEIIEKLLDKKSVLGILPTGSGKTVTYALPTLMNNWHTLIISPLISLMEDQALRLNQVKKNSAVYLNSSQTKQEHQYLLNHLASFHFILMSPEMLQNTEVQHALIRVPFQLGVVDEAHCISNWGFDFRPEYLQLPLLFKKLNIPQTLALTATAPKEVKKDIHHYLFQNQKIPEISFPVNRPNIGYLVENVNDEKEKFQRLQEIFSNLDESGIIYCNTRKQCEDLAFRLQKTGLSCSYYHGGVDVKDRKALLVQFQKNNLQVMIATSAFGMGIDKKDIRFVIHYEFPASLEDYVQETGRCGRDGKEGFALLFYHSADGKIHQHFNQQRSEEASEMYARLEEAAIPVAEFNQKIQLKNRSYYVMERFLQSENCYRENIAKFFGDEKPVIPSLCCSHHQTTVEDYFKVFSKNKEEVPLEKPLKKQWQDILNDLFFEKD